MYKKIVVPLDGSKRAEKVLPHVEQLAHCFGAKVGLLRVIRPPSMVVHDPSALKRFHDNFQKLHKNAEKYLAAIAGEFGEKGIEAQGWVTTGSVVGEIMDAAKREDADLIAMCSHGRGGLARLFYGSVAAGILHRVDRPLLIIRSRGDS